LPIGTFIKRQLLYNQRPGFHSDLYVIRDTRDGPARLSTRAQFNYGFNEESWEAYSILQRDIRADLTELRTKFADWYRKRPFVADGEFYEMEDVVTPLHPRDREANFGRGSERGSWGPQGRSGGHREGWGRWDDGSDQDDWDDWDDRDDRGG